MQQDTYFYHNFPQDPRLQFPTASSFPPQENTPQWSGNYMPEVNLSQAQNGQNQFNYANHLQVASNITPVSTAVYGSTPTFSWAHTVPSLMPWVTQGDHNVPDPVMRFTAPFPPDPCTSQTATSWELLNNWGANKANVNMHLKRKSDLDAVETAEPYKMCITEEKMAARLKELHISNQYSVPAESSPFGPYNSSSNSAIAEKSVTNLQDLEAMLKGSSADGSSKSLILAPELKKLVEPEKIFARTFLDKVERPSMAVVLWQPQNKLLPNVNNSNNNTNETKEKDEKESRETNISLLKGDNNNFIPRELSAIGNQSSSFTMASSREVSSSVNCEDVMDT